MQESAIDTRLLRHTGPIRELERGWLGHDAFQRRGQPAFEFSVCWLNAAFALSLNAVSCLQGVNNNAPMRVGSAPENYNTTGGYALYPGQPCTQFLRLWRRCCCCYFLTVLSLTLPLRLDSALMISLPSRNRSPAQLRPRCFGALCLIPAQVGV